MSNACATSLVSLAARRSSAQVQSISSSHSWATLNRNAFYARFFAIATRSLSSLQSTTTPSLQSISACGPLGVRTARPNPRHFSTSSPCSKRAARGTPPPQQRRRRQHAGQVRIPFDSLPDAKLREIFKHDVKEEEGNLILKTLHTRRVDGSLVESGTHIEDVSELPQEAYENALSWLRQTYPIDEQAAANVWLGRELSKVEKSYIQRAERLGLYKRVENNDSTQEEETSTADTSTSVIDQFKNYHKKRREKEAAEEEIRKQTPEYKAQEELRLARVEEKKSKELLWQERLQERKAQLAEQGKVSDFQEPPDMSNFMRLAPSTLLGIIVLVGCYWYADNYLPPSKENRMYPLVPVSIATVGGLVAFNMSITSMWRFPFLHKTFNKFLLAVPAYPYAFSMVGNIFSHVQWRHLASNMSTLVIYGVTLHEEIGRGNFMSVYVSGGVMGSICSLYYFVLTKTLNTSHCGASGATWAIVAAWSYLTATNPPSSTESWDFSFDVARYILVVIQIMNHFSRGVFMKVDVFAHIAGALTGLFVAYNLRQGSIPARSSQKQKEAEQSRLRLEEEDAAEASRVEAEQANKLTEEQPASAKQNWSDRVRSWLG